LGSGVGSAGVDEGQARVNVFVAIAPCPRRHPQPDAMLLESHRGWLCIWGGGGVARPDQTRDQTNRQTNKSKELGVVRSTSVCG
jgi:hypothetical protein